MSSRIDVQTCVVGAPGLNATTASVEKGREGGLMLKSAYLLNNESNVS
jgi:hypothetical protein